MKTAYTCYKASWNKMSSAISKPLKGAFCFSFNLAFIFFSKFYVVFTHPEEFGGSLSCSAVLISTSSIR